MNDALEYHLKSKGLSRRQFGALGLGDPQAQHLLVAGQVHADGQIHCALADWLGI